MKLSHDEKGRLDGSRVSFALQISNLLTSTAGAVMSADDDFVDLYGRFDRLNPGDVTPDAEDSIVRFLLVRLRLAETFRLYEDSDRTMLALSRWGAESADVFDALEGVDGFWECRPLSGSLFWPAGTRNVPVMPVKSRTGRRRS